LGYRLGYKLGRKLRFRVRCMQAYKLEFKLGYKKVIRIAIIASATALLLHGPVVADYSNREDVRAYVNELVADHGFQRDALLTVFADAEHQPRIVEAMSRPAEKRLKWFEYRRIFIKDARLDRGVEFWADNQAALESARAAYNVAPEYIVAIIGVETYFGRVMGSHRVLDALSTLAFDYPRRARFFRNELTEFLLLTREENRSPAEPKGSYAGAMGYGQFIPSSYRRYAVDFDGDGVDDLVMSAVHTGPVGMVRAMLGNAIAIDLVLHRLHAGVYRKQPDAARTVRSRLAPLDHRGPHFPTVLLGDVTGDARMDLLTGTRWNELNVYRGIGAPNILASEPVRVAVAVPSNERNAMLADLDGDGRQDVVIHHPAKEAESSHRVLVLLSRLGLAAR